MPLQPPPRKRSIPTTPQTGNFRPPVEKGRWAAKKGTLPLPSPTTIPEILTKVVVHACRKILFIDPKIRLMTYATCLFFFSLVADYMPFPTSYFSHKGNFLNVYFVKFSWAWTFVLTGMFIYLTSSTYSCGKRDRILRHLLRLVIGTIVWFGWTFAFTMVEESTGQCVLDQAILHSVNQRRACVSKNGQWMSFDISGHSFLLIWCVFFMTEEAKAIIGWDNIKELIRIEDYNRSKAGSSGEASALGETSLNGLSEEEFTELKTRYEVYNVPVKVLLILITVLSCIWDLMVFMTSIYYHVMVEKVLGGFVAAFSWFVMYRVLYKYFWCLPGQGLFKYNFEAKTAVASSTKPSQPSNSSGGSKPKNSGGKARPAKEADDIPKFLGMPLYALRNAKKSNNSSEHLESPT